MAVQILVGHCVDLMARMAPASVQCIVTSPPYWALRDYGTEPVDWPAITYSPMAGVPACIEVPAMRASLGLEPTLEAFIGHMILVFRAARRVLKDDGVAWVNMGDSYSGGRRGGNSEGITGEADESRAALEALIASRRRDDAPIPRSDVIVPGLAPKNLVGQPWRLAFALQADGWHLRQDVIWHKPNPMPESVADRCTKAHEYVFLLAKSARYYFDAEAIKEPASPDTHARYGRGRSEDHKHAQAQLVPGRPQQTIAKGFAHMRKPVAGWASGPGSHSAIEHTTAAAERGQLLQRTGNGVGWGHGYDADPKPRTKGRKELPETQAKLAAYRDNQRKLAAADSGTKNNDSFDAAMAVMPENRNKRSVWSVTIEGYSGAHFATFPPKLIEPCILAGSREGDTVLDPFGGAATTGLVADRLGREALLCELNPDYAGLGRQRIAGDAGHVARQRGLDLEASG